jgi:hypothetical protein
MPDDDQDGAPDRNGGAFFASGSGDAPIACSEEGVGFGGGDGYLTEDSGQLAVAMPGGCVAFGFSGGGLEPG